MNGFNRVQNFQKMSDSFDDLLSTQAGLIADYQQKALGTTDAQRCSLWATTLNDLITGYFKLLNKDQKIMALSQPDLDLVIASIKDNGAATAKVVELQTAIAAKTAELTTSQANDATDQAQIATLTTSLQEDQTQLDSIKAALAAVGTPVVEPPVVTPPVEPPVTSGFR